ncbi:MAG TPA: aspartate 1-decarboxylase, partial [Gemmatales bacterium]|nr:aspartate 1-decarboxylase [Gemmatales bacterium]
LLRSYLAAKLHGIRVTDKNLHYVGSLSLGREFLRASGMVEHEEVQIVNVTTGARFTTYIIVAEEPGTCALNGGAARLAEVGDRLIVMTFALSDQPLEPRIVFIDDRNQIEKTTRGEQPGDRHGG